MNLVKTQNQETMSSSQLAEMLNYEKKEINRKIKSMFQEKIDGGLITPSFDGRGYVTEYFLPELESKMFVAKWDIDYLEMITQFWIDKGKSAQPNWISQLSPEAKIAIEDLSNQVTLANAEVDRLQGVCNTITAQFATGVTPTAFCKQMNGINVQQVNNTLFKMGVLIKTSHGFEPSSYARDRYFKVSFHEYEEGKQRSTVTLTKTGAKWLYKAYLSNKLPMKSTWNGSHVHMIFED